MNELAVLIAGLVLLVGGAELLVRSSVAIAGRLGVPPLVIGLTIVSFGTSAPEAVASITAAGVPFEEKGAAQIRELKSEQAALLAEREATAETMLD